MYYLETGKASNTRFRNAVLIALAAHAMFVAFVSFRSSEPSLYKTPQIEVTLATRPSTAAPEHASNLAQVNQDGSGDESDRTDLSTRNTVTSDSPSEQQSSTPARREQVAQQTDVLTTTGTAQRVVTTERPEKTQKEVLLEGINPEIDRITQELASLQAELAERTLAHADSPRVRRLTAASAKQSVDAAYLLDWRRRLEAVGTQYYPQASVRYGMYGELRMLVVIRQDGTLDDIRILSSSGFAVLDEAAIKIVRMAAPYSPFPPELAATTDKLEIVRTWHFQENELSSP
jgi:protein TonB